MAKKNKKSVSKAKRNKKSSLTAKKKQELMEKYNIRDCSVSLFRLTISSKCKFDQYHKIQFSIFFYF